MSRHRYTAIYTAAEWEPHPDREFRAACTSIGGGSHGDRAYCVIPRGADPRAVYNTDHPAFGAATCEAHCDHALWKELTAPDDDAPTTIVNFIEVDELERLATKQWGKKWSVTGPVTGPSSLGWLWFCDWDNDETCYRQKGRAPTLREALEAVAYAEPETY